MVQRRRSKTVWKRCEMQPRCPSKMEALRTARRAFSDSSSGYSTTTNDGMKWTIGGGKWADRHPLEMGEMDDEGPQSLQGSPWGTEAMERARAWDAGRGILRNSEEDEDEDTLADDILPKPER
ncbi:unnamed protein product, partial [Mesorhabditis spiculigera]